MSRFLPLRAIGLAFGEVIRNTPILVQLLWVYYVLPIVFNIRISSFAAILIGLSVYQAAFISEVYRAGIQAVPKGHQRGRAGSGADAVPGLPPHRAAAGDPADAAAAGLELRAADQVLLARRSDLGDARSRVAAWSSPSSTFRPLEIFSFIAVVYFCICWPLAMAIRIWERRLASR